MSPDQLSVLPEGFAHKFSNTYVSVYSCRQRGILICSVISSYIHIEAFKAIFQNCSKIVEEDKIRKFIFDKRMLRAFHQPSMEWYFVEWKQEMYKKHNLSMHYKLLPPENWFRKCVEAGRHEISQKYPQNIFGHLDIRYIATIEEALQN